MRLTVERRRVEVAGRRLWALTYNGRYMPPTLRIRPGDRLELTLANHLPSYTNLHVHGLHVSPGGNSDNIFVQVRSGGTFHYSYRFPPTVPPGTYWYHSHAHPISAPQVAGGLSGVIVVEGLRRLLPPRLRHITEHVIALKDFQTQGDAVRTSGLKVGAATTRTVNGQLAPVIRIRPGELQLWRLANIGANIYYRLRLPGTAFQVLARDGSPVPRVRSADSLLLAAGARYDVLVRGGPPGRAELLTLPYSTGPGGNTFPRAVLATVVSAGPPVRGEAAPSGVFAPAVDLRGAAIAARSSLVLRIRFRTFTGRTVLHCHILNHEDAGMMAVLQIDP